MVRRATSYLIDRYRAVGTVKRRTVLTLVSGIGATATSGCLGYSLQKSSAVDERKTRIEELQSSVSEKESRIAELESQVDDLESEIESRSNEIAELESRVDELQASNDDVSAELERARRALEDARAEQVLYLYNAGLTLKESAEQFYDSSTDRIENESYDAARADMNVAAGYYDSARASMEDARGVAETLDESTVRGDCDSAMDHCQTMLEAASHYQIALWHLGEGRDSEANDSFDAGDADYETAQSYSVQSLSHIENHLGTSIDA